MSRLVRAWITLVALGLPAAERARWREEWRSDLQGLESRGAGVGRRIGWALGLVWTVGVFRSRGMTMDGWGREVRTAVRGFVREPGFTLLAVLTLGLGIGANTAMFSVVNGVILEPLRYPQPGELVEISSAFPTMDFHDFWLSPPEYFELGERSRTLEVVGGFRAGTRTVGGGDRPERIRAARVTHTFFDVLAVPPALGRTFLPEEDLPDAEPVAVLSWELWTRSFGGDRDLLGGTIEVDGASTRVVGIMPPGFDIVEEDVELWVPAGLDPVNRENRASHFLEVVGRLAEGSDVASARTEVAALVERWEEDSGGAFHVPEPEVHPLSLTPLHEEVVGDVRPALMVLLGAVGFVLLIACANVANLLLVRGEDRRREVAVRAALGAGRGRLLRQFLTEGTVLSLTGAAAGLGLAWLCLEGLRMASPPDVPRLAEVQLDGTVLAVTTGIAVAVGLFFGLAPGRSMLADDLAGTLGSEGIRSTETGSRRSIRSILVALEMALALMLAVGAGLMVRSFDALSRVEPGFQAEGILTFQTYLPPGDYPGAQETSAFLDRLLRELEASPGIESAAATGGLPTRQTLAANDTEFQSLEPDPDGPPHNVDYYTAVSHGYLETMGMTLVEGRAFLPSDGPDARYVAVVNRSLAERFYPDRSALGELLRPCCGNSQWWEIVGVVEDVKQSGLDAEPGTEVYFHEPQAGGRSWSVVARTRGEPGAAAPAVRSVMGRLDPALPVAQLQPMTGILSEATSRNAFLTSLMAGFAGLALLLAAVGTYGVMSYTVSRRARELGIRVAMGAPSSSVLRLVLVQGLRIAGVGLVLGLLGAWSLTGLLESLLYDVPTRDPVSFLVGPMVLAAVAILACWMPARRATRLDPMQVLRGD